VLVVNVEEGADLTESSEVQVGALAVEVIV